MKFLSRHRVGAAVSTPRVSSPSDDEVQAVDELIAKGNQLEDDGAVEGACLIYEEAIRTAPDSHRAHLNLGNALRLLGRTYDAADEYRQAIRLIPDSAGAYVNLGNVLIANGALHDAETSYRTAIRLRPEWPEAWFGLGCVLEKIPATARAIEAYEEALRLDPGHGKVAANLGRVLQKNGETLAAKAVLERVLLHAPDAVPALCARAEIDRQLGDPEAAVAAYREVLAVAPPDVTTYSNYLFALNFLAEISGEAIRAEHQRFGEWLGGRITSKRVRPRGASEKRLKIGYVSPDFRRHSVSCFIEPLLRHHDRAAVEVHCYYNHADRDEITRRFTELADHWHDIAGVSDEVVAQGIVADGIDILVDLAGHTADNRLGVFARKPAPIQFTWLGYLCTTGLDAIDYRLCDAHTDPLNEAEYWQVETPARLPDSQWCYQPQIALPEPSELPRLTNGYWTFGSFNQAAKLNSSTLQIWARLLNEIPDSRLRIVGINDSLLEERIRSQFAVQGVSADRLDLIGRIPIESYFSSYCEIDIALDSFPYNGATTTCDALAMGVPVATVAGARSIARGGLSLLRTLGMEDWVAASNEGLVALLRDQTRNPERLATLRSELPGLIRASTLMDGPRFARNLEAIFRTAWRRAVQADAVPRDTDDN